MEWLLPSPRLLPRKTVVRSSKLLPSSWDCLSLAKVADGLHGFQFDDLELFEFARVLAMVRKVVMAKRHSFDRWSETGSGKHNRDQARRVGLNRQMAEVEEQTRAADEVSRVGDVFGRFDIHFRLWLFRTNFRR